MIDQSAFVVGMAALSGAFGREIDGAVQRMYYSVLNPKLSTQEFQDAIKATLERETFWPSPAVILAKVPRLKEDAGHLAFEHVNRVTSEHGGYRFLPHDTFLREFDAATQAAIRSVGGLARIANTSEEHWTALSKRFAAAYQTGASLPSGDAPKQITDGKVSALVRNVSDKLDFRKAASGER